MPRTSAFSAKVPAMSQTAIFTTAQRKPVALQVHVGPPGEGSCAGVHPRNYDAHVRRPRLRTSQVHPGGIRSKSAVNGRSEDDVRRWLGAAGAAILISVASPYIGSRRAAPQGRFIVVLTDPVASPSQVAAAHARRYHLGVSAVYRSAIRGYAATVPGPALAALRADPRVASVTPDRPVPDPGAGAPHRGEPDRRRPEQHA